jgi:hypothetical protein
MNSDSTVSERVELKPMSAIQNAFCFIGDISGATVYSTNFPNAESMKEIIQRGVSCIKYLRNITLEENEVKVVQKLAMKNPISLRRYGASNSQIDIDPSSQPPKKLSLDDIWVKVIPLSSAITDYKLESQNPDNIKLVIPKKTIAKKYP